MWRVANGFENAALKGIKIDNPEHVLKLCVMGKNANTLRQFYYDTGKQKNMCNIILG